MKKFYVGVKGVTQSPRGILLLQSKKEGFWNLPGGRVDGAENFAETLQREFTEEVPGATVHNIGDVLAVHRLKKDVDGYTSLVLVYVSVSVSLPEKISLSDEHSDYTFVSSVDELSALDINAVEVREALKEILLKVKS